MLKSKKAKIAFILTVAIIIGFIGFNIYQIHFVPKVCYRPMIYYNNTLFWDVNVVARKNDDTGLRIEYIGTVDSLVPETEKPDSEFECNSREFMNARLYRDENSAYYLRCTNGNLLLLKNSNGTDIPVSKVNRS